MTTHAMEPGKGEVVKPYSKSLSIREAVKPYSKAYAAKLESQNLHIPDSAFTEMNPQLAHIPNSAFIL